MNQKAILVGVAAFFVGVLASGAIAAYAVNGNHAGVMNMYAMHRTESADDNNESKSTASSMSMFAMTADLKTKTGDAFDRGFTSEMIAHHQGAIDMANLAQTNASHQEVKDLAKNILSAQTSEITQMKDWQTQWGYTGKSMMDGHSMMGM